MQHNPFPRGLVAALVLAMVVLLVAGGWFYRAQAQALRQDAEEELQTIAALKVGQIASWRAERLGDAAVLMKSALAADAARSWLAAPDAEKKERLLSHLRALVMHHPYDNILLVDAEGRVRLSLKGPPTALNAEVAEALASAWRRQGPVLSNLHSGPEDSSPHICAVAPLFTRDEQAPLPAGAFVLQSDAREFLYPLIQSWPVASETAETLLIQRDGDHVLFLNDLRHQANTALTLRLPLSRNDLPAVMAVQGRAGPVQGVDYRGVEVLAVLKAVPESPWFMVAKVDEAEALAVWRSWSTIILALWLGLVVATVAAAGMAWQRNQKAHYRALFQAEAARRRTEARHRTTLMSVGDGVIVTDAKGVVELMNPVAEQLTGWSEADAAGKPLKEVFPIVYEDTRHGAENPVARALREGAVVGLANHSLLMARDGREVPIADSAAPIKDEHGDITGVILVFRDQTEERSAQKALRESEERFRHAFDYAAIGRGIAKPTGEILRANPVLADLLGYTQQEMLTKTWMGVSHPEDLAKLNERIQRLLEGEVPSFNLELRLVRKDGDPVWVYLNVVLIRGAEGGSSLLLGDVVDLTQRKQVEREIRVRVTQRAIVAEIGRRALAAEDLSSLMARAVHLVAQALYVEYAKVLELLPGGDALLLRAGFGWRPGLVGQATVSAGLESQAGYTLFSRAPVIVEDLSTETRFSGPTILHDHGVVSGISVIIQGEGRPFGVMGAHTTRRRAFSQDDVHFLQAVANVLAEAIHRQRSEEAVIRAMQEWQTTFDAANDAIWILDDDSRILRSNRRGSELFHRSNGELIGQYCWEVAHGTTQPVPECPHVLAQHSLKREMTELQIGEGWFQVAVDPVLDADGQYTGAIHIVRDITEQRRLQEQLRQSQKMEAIGQLAGGVAHDFNNLLTGIKGYLDFAIECAEPGSRLREDLQQVDELADQAESLTRQLLAFGRRQTLQMAVLNVNELIMNQLNLLDRLLGEDIDIQFTPAASLDNVRADRGQIEQVILNLAVNARDAMPDGGRLMIEATNVTLSQDDVDQHMEVAAGPYVMIAVSDTGCGMDEETRTRAFEPFFTTKEVGKGTGLGLATVYGIVKQHGGDIWVYSEVGKGTTFKIYLPVVAEGTTAREPDRPRAGGGSETILLVEDEAAVREVSRRILEGYGYRVFAAESPDAAEEIAKGEPQIDLLLTDVVLPGRNGRELYESLAAARPELKVLYMSGYTNNAIAHRGVLDEGTLFLPKPFDSETLAVKVRDALDG